MSNLRFERPRKKKEGTGFYIALVGCLAAIVAVTWTAVGNLDSVSPDTSSALESSDSASNTQETGAIPNQYIDGFDWGDELTEEYESIMEGISSAESSAPVSSEKKDSAADTSSKEKDGAKQTAAQPASSAAASSKRDVDKEVSSFNAGAKQTAAKTYMLPVGNEVLKEYSGGNLVYSLTFGDWRVHDGVDFKAGKTEMVRAAGDGTIKDIYQDPMYGTVIVIDHGDMESYYCGMDEKVQVEKGQQVLMGDDLGTLGDIPCEIVDEIHLHFGMKKGGKWIDPIEGMRKK